MSGGQYFSTYVEDLEQDPFDAMDFVERLAWRMTGGSETISDPITLKNKFEEEIGSLQMLCEQFQSKINNLEKELERDKTDYVKKLQNLYEKNGDALEKMKQLDSTMQNVSAKVVHLGDQLESVHIPRSRANDALQLIQHFDEFLSEQPLNSIIFTDPDKLLESADLIQKLYSISQELSHEKFAHVQNRIAHRYKEVENLLMEEFVRAQRDEKKMSEVAKILSEFKGYSDCVDGYVEYIQSHSHSRNGDVFADALQLVNHYKPKIESIFPSPTQVIQKLVLNVFSGKIKENVYARLRDCKECNDNEGYLTGLAHSFSSALKLCKELEQLQVSSDSSFLQTLTRGIFDRYLSTYAKEELEYLNSQCASILGTFYKFSGHIKKQIQSGGFQELKRDVQARLLPVETYGGKTFLSEDVAISILQETKNAFSRTSQLCRKSDIPQVVDSILDVLLKYLYFEHLDYAVELAIAGITLVAEPKTEPPPYIFSVVAQNTAIVLLLIKQYEDSVYPSVKNTSIEQAVAKKWATALLSLEQKINLGLERQLNAIIGYCRYILNTEQKKTDFLKSDKEQLNLGGSIACQQVLKFLKLQHTAMERGCDGENLIVLQSELASRLHKMLVNHVQQFMYDSAGAMSLLCDLNVYKQYILTWKCNEANALFDGLLALANLLVVLPENLADAANSAVLADVNRSLIHDFLKLRQDRGFRVNTSPNAY
ncbi:unnamed protein product [Auanema sp. JU1783]|nr:unnamed protein product [Auanema sp. JU1783]